MQALAADMAAKQLMCRSCALSAGTGCLAHDLCHFTQVSEQLTQVCRAAIVRRLHVESCHPCLAFKVYDRLAEGQVCVQPAVVVDPRFGIAGLDGDVRVSAEFEAISSG